MSWLSREDGPLHYSDGTHRWVAWDDDQEKWETKVRAHLEAHLSTRAGHNPYRSPPLHIERCPNCGWRL
jgi:hypothetical protein